MYYQDIVSKNRFKQISIKRLHQLQISYYRYFVIQLIHGCLFYSIVGLGVQPLLLGLSGVVCFILYCYLILVEMRGRTESLSPFLFYLIGSALRLGIATVYVAIVVAENESRVLMIGPVDTSMWLMEGHLIAMVGDVVFVFSYVSFQSFKLKRSNMFKEGSEYIRQDKIYLSGLALVVIASILTLYGSYVSLVPTGQIATILTAYGIPAGVFLMLHTTLNHKISYLSAISICVPLIILTLNVYFSLYSYMSKSHAFIAVLPITILALMQFRKTLLAKKYIKLFKTLIMISVFAYFMMFLLTSYTLGRRPLFTKGTDSILNINKQERDIPEVWPSLYLAALASLPGTNEFREYHKFPSSGMWSLPKRLTVTHVNAWSYARVKSSGTKDENFFISLLNVITPRIFWPDKSEISPSMDFAKSLWRSAGSNFSTSIGLTMPGAYYWWGGVVGLITGMFCSGMAFALVWSFVRADWTQNPVSALVTFTLFWNGFHWFEGAFFGGFPLYLYIIIVFFPLVIFTRRILKIRLLRFT